jgi:hypothetical protein
MWYNNDCIPLPPRRNVNYDDDDSDDSDDE